jgi:hypothetical protein
MAPGIERFPVIPAVMVRPNRTICRGTVMDQVKPNHDGNGMIQPDRKPLQEETMALQLRPNCEYCDKDLPPHAADARIFTYECTFCASCVETVLFNVCPNCAGGFVPRPVRPVTERRPGVSLARQPASTTRVHLSWDKAEIAAFVMTVRDIEPGSR